MNVWEVFDHDNILFATETELEFAAACNWDRFVINEILNGCASTSELQTVMLFACMYGNAEIVNMLLCDDRYLFQDGYSPSTELSTALECKQWEIVLILVTDGRVYCDQHDINLAYISGYKSIFGMIVYYFNKTHIPITKGRILPSDGVRI